MAILTLKNTSGSEILIGDVGAVIAALGQDTYISLALIQGLAASQQVRALVAAGTLVVNDGLSDLAVIEAIGYLDSLWSSAGTGQIPLLPPGFIFNARLNWETVQDVSIGTVGTLSVVKDSRASRDIFWKGQLSARMTVVGPGGLQTGSVEAANTWYRVLVIADSAGVNPPAGLLVPDGTPFSEPGYDVFRRVGYVRNNAGSNFLKFFQGGDGPIRFIFYDEAAANLAMLVNGNATAFADVSLAPVVPPIGRATVYLGAAFENAGAGTAATDELMLRPKGSTVATPVIRMAPGILLTQKQKQNMLMFVDASQTLQYQVSAANDSADIAVVGYYDEL